jgi:Prokaryotic N-terminal methylation motif
MKLPPNNPSKAVPPATAAGKGPGIFWKFYCHLLSFRHRLLKRAVNPFARTRSASGFTLVETMVAMATGSLLIGSVVALGMYTGRSFNIMGNYVDLDAQSRHAADVLGQHIRDASALVAFSTNNPAYLTFTNDTAGIRFTITYNASTATLVLTETGLGSETLLTDCDEWTFSLYDRCPDITTNSISFYPATNSMGQLDPNFCKLINMSWKCSRTILGAKLNTESVQTAQIVLRNKIQE